MLLSHLQWARILVKYDGRVLPRSLQVVVGCSSFSIQLWWEAPPRFSMVASRSSCSGYFGHEERDDEDGSHTSVGVGKEGQLGCLAGNVVLQSFGWDAQFEEAETVNFTNSAKVEEDQEQGERTTTKEGGACLVVPSVEETKWRSRVRDVVKGQVPSPMSGLVWSHMALTNETLMAEAIRFPPLSNLGLMNYGSQLLMMLRQYGSLLENSGTDPKDPSGKELAIKARESKPSKALELACVLEGDVSLPSM